MLRRDRLTRQRGARCRCVVAEARDELERRALRVRGSEPVLPSHGGAQLPRAVREGAVRALREHVVLARDDLVLANVARTGAEEFDWTEVERATEEVDVRSVLRACERHSPPSPSC